MNLWGSCFSLFQQFDELRIGSPGIKPVPQLHPLQSLTASTSSEQKSASSRLSSMITGMGFLKNALPKSSSDSGNTSSSSSNQNQHNSNSVVTMATGRQDAEFGSASGLLGQLASVAVFYEALSDDQMETINAAGNYHCICQQFYQDLPLLSVLPL